MKDPGTIGGHQRVAAFLLSLGPETAKGVLRHLREDVIEDVVQAMADLDPRLSEAGTVEELYRDLALSVHGPKRLAAADEGELTKLLSATYGLQESQGILARIHERRRRDRPFLDVERHPPQRVARALATESVAIAAMVLGHLDPARAAEIIKYGDEERTLETVRRMATLETPPTAILARIASQLAERLDSMEDEGDEPEDSRLRSIAEILNNSSPEIEQKVLATISEGDGDMAAELREYLFTWEDIASVDKRSMQKILGTVDTKTLSIALKACSSGVEENLMGNLSSRVKEMVAEERELAGAISMDNVLAAREEIMKNIRAMIEAGEFRPMRAGEDLVT